VVVFPGSLLLQVSTLAIAQQTVERAAPQQRITARADGASATVSTTAIQTKTVLLSGLFMWFFP
jgi:hypothetical protein